MKHKNHNHNTAELYFNQKRWTWVDTVSVVMIAVGAVMFTFVPGFGPIGIPIALIGAVIKIFSSNAKVKDSDYDEELNKLIGANYIETKRKINDDYTDVTHKLTLCNYDVSEAPVIIGKDHKARAKSYYIATFEFKDDACSLELCKINVPEKRVAISHYSLPLPCGYEITEKPSMISDKKCFALKLENVPEFPIDMNSTDTDIVLNKLK